MERQKSNLPISRLGQTTGRLSAVATTGSLLGAFLPVLWLIPAFGTRRTFYLLALMLLLTVSISARRHAAPLGAPDCNRRWCW
jgi:nitrate/nitrite transporter NarK